MIITQESSIFNNHEKIKFKTVKLTTISDRGRSARGYVAACNGTGKIRPVLAAARLAKICYATDSNTFEYNCNLGAHDLLDQRLESRSSRRQLVIGLGVRLPLLNISRYGKQGIDSHVQSEDGGILRLVDKRANSRKRRSFDFSQSPRNVVQIGAPRKEVFIERQSIDQRPPDADVKPQ